MKVAKDNVVGLNVRGAAGSQSSHARVYAAHRLAGDEEHDARGLIVAIALCIACWAGLGYFLLS